MSVLMPLTGLIVGFLLVYQLNITVPLIYASYLAVAVLATIDTVVGGIRAGIDHKFDREVFISGFFINSITAGLLAYLGDRYFGVQLTLAATIIFGYRIFQNISLIRTHWIANRRRRTGPPPTGDSDPAIGMLESPGTRWVA